MYTIKNTLLAVSAGAYALFACSVQAASLGDAVYFDFTRTGTATSLVDPGNTFSFTDSSGVYDLTAAGYSRAKKRGVEAATLVHTGSDYSPYGYSAANDVTGLGVCSGGDSNGRIGNCLRHGNQFAVDSNSAAEWVLLTVPEELNVTGIRIMPVRSSPGEVNVYSGTVSGKGIFDNMTSVINYRYRSNSGPQLLELDPVLGKSILIGTEKRAARYTVTGLYAEVVPLPASVYLLGSALLALAAGRRHRSRRLGGG